MALIVYLKLFGKILTFSPKVILTNDFFWINAYPTP